MKEVTNEYNLYKVTKMFNFNLQKRAFDELNAEQFRVVYFLNSTLSMVNKQKNTPDNNSIEMFNGYMMDKLGLSERQVQRLIKSLEHTGFISVERATTKKQPNTITLIDTENDATTCDKNGDKNVTLNNLDIKYNNKNNNITKDLSTSTRTSTEVTLLEENKKNKIKNISSEVTPSTGTFQDEVESVFLSFSDDDWLSYEVKRSMMDEVNNNSKLIDMKENEMSDNGTNAMNDNEQGSNDIAECGTTTNEMTTSTSGEENITSRDDVDNSKVENEKNDTPTDKGLKLNATAPTKDEITLMKQTLWQIKGKKTYNEFKAYEDRFIQMMNDYKAANPNDTFIEIMRNWYKNSRKYFPKDEIPQEQLQVLDYHLDTLRLADTVEKLDNALRIIDNWFGRFKKYENQLKELEKKVNSVMQSETKKHKDIWQQWAEKMEKAS